MLEGIAQSSQPSLSDVNGARLKRSVASHAPRNPKTRERMPVTEYVEVPFPGPSVPTDTGQRDA